MATARIRYVEALRIDWLEQDITPQNIDALASYIAPYRGDGCDVVIGFETNQATGDVKLGPQWKIRPDDELIHELEKHYGKQKVQLVYT